MQAPDYSNGIMSTMPPANGVNDSASSRPEFVNRSANEKILTHTNSKANHMSTPSGPDIQAAVKASTAHLQRAENLKKAEELRAKVIALRENAGKKVDVQQCNPSDAYAVAAIGPKPDVEHKSEPQLPPEDLFRPEALMAAGKAAAQAKMTGPEQSSQVPTALTIGPSAATQCSARNAQPPQSTVAAPRYSKPEKTEDKAQKVRPVLPIPPVNFDDAYYADLKIWLEITGYHNIEYRTSKLERHELEQQAARIAQRLQKLQQDEAASIAASVRPTPAIPAANNAARPTLPLRSLPHGNGSLPFETKRAHSPEPTQPWKARRTDRNANLVHVADSPDEADRGRRVRNPSPNGVPLEARITYPSPRRRPLVAEIDNAQLRRDRDLSLERRQQHYGPGMNARREHDLFNPPRRGSPAGPAGFEDRGRLRYSAVNDQGWHDGGRFKDDHRDARLDLMRGGRRRPR